MIFERMFMLLASVIVLSGCFLYQKEQRKSVSPAAQQQVIVVKGDSSKKVLKRYNEIITDKAISDDGLFRIHQVEGRYYFEIPDSILGRDILIVNRIGKAATSVPMSNGPVRIGYAGDQIGENVVRFEKGPEQKIFIKRISYLDISNDSTDNGMFRSVKNSNFLPIVATFDIKTVLPDSLTAVIDLTDYIKGDNDIFFFNPGVKQAFKLGALQPDRSFISGISSFPLNTEIKTIKTYVYADNSLTYELNSSIVLLPEKPMQPRFYDERVGYFSRGYRDFDFPQAGKPSYMITRWRLEPKENEIENYKRGELVEPKRPIVFYIDPATPKKWVTYLIQGVNAWQAAFEKAGFKKAIYALEAPVDDSTWSLYDARHNAIVYKASFVENASGPQINDPRSGEILESHINWYHNVQQLLHDLYFIQVSPNDTSAQKMNFDDSLMGRLIRYVCTHEVGHTLGLKHNFIASSTMPVDSLRSKTYVKKFGHTPSVMDYARFNYVAQPEDQIPVDELIPHIGIYDEWAIEWGYRWIPEISTKEGERNKMNTWISQRIAKDSRLSFATDRDGDFRNQMEDLGDDPMKAGELGINNLKQIMLHIMEWTRTPDNNYSDLRKMHIALLNQYRRYMELVLANVGGTSVIPKTVEQQGPIMVFAGRERQISAVKFFHQQLFDNTHWLESKELFPLIGGGSIILLYNIQENILHRLVSATTYNMLLLNETNQPKEIAYSFDELLTDLEHGILKELDKHQNIDIYRRTVQKIYITKLITFVQLNMPGDMGLLDGCTIVSDHIDRIYKKIEANLAYFRDQESKLHLEDLLRRLKAAINERKKYLGIQPQVIMANGNKSLFDNGNAKEIFIDTKAIHGTKSPRSCWGGIE